MKRNSKTITATFALSAVLAISASAQAPSSPGKQSGLTNPGFEEPRGKEGSFTFAAAMPGWKTTDKEFEIWSSGFEGVAAHEGNQFVELNAWIDGILYQDSTGIEAGSVLEFTFAHRGRVGEDTMKLTITDLGADNSLGGGDDTMLFTKEYTTGKDAWAVYSSTKEAQFKALGNTVRFAYGAISSAGGSIGAGNFLDAANFGIGVVSNPKTKGKPTEHVFGEKATLTGKLEQIKTNDDDGKAVFPYYLTTDNGIIVKAAVDFDPGDTGEKLEGMEVKLIKGDDSALEPFKGKRVTISGQIATDTGLHCHAFGLFVDAIKNIEENPASAGNTTSASNEPGTQPGKDIREFWKVAEPEWKAGPITKLEGEEVDGTVQTHTSTGLAMITEISEIGEYGYTISHKLINTTDKVLLALHEVNWSHDPVKKLTETLYEFDSTPAKKHFREQEMKAHFFDMKSKPQSVEGTYATEKLDEKGVATLKEENAYWWEGGLK
jgi:hypothetical protein